MKLQPQILSQRCTRDRYLGLMVLLLLGTTGGCSWLREPAKQPLPAAAQPLERARAYTRDFPDKALGWQERATLELTAAGGDIPGLSRSIERAHALAQPSLRSLLAAAESALLTGSMDVAFERFATLASQAPLSGDPLAPALTEIAVVTLGQMRSSVRNHTERVKPVLQSVIAVPGMLQARHAALMQLLDTALRQGRSDQAELHARAAGCIQQVRVAGPFGPHPLLDIEGPLLGKGRQPLPDALDLGPGRGKQPTRDLKTRWCLLNPGAGSKLHAGGLHVVQTRIDRLRPENVLLRVESPNSMVIRLDGKEVARIDRRRAPLPGPSYHRLHLGTGRHELEIRVSSRHIKPVLLMALIPEPPGALEASRNLDAEGPFERYLAARIAQQRGDSVRARELLRTLPQPAPGPGRAVLEASVALDDPLRPAGWRSDRARELLDRTRTLHPDVWFPALQIANLQASEGQLQEAISALRGHTRRWPRVTALDITLVGMLERRGWQEQAEQAAERLLREAPAPCAVLHLAMHGPAKRGQRARLQRLVERAMQCDARSSERYNSLRNQRRWKEAAAELKRLHGLSDHPSEAEQWSHRISLARLARRAEEIPPLLEAQPTLEPRSENAWTERVDSLLARGQRDDAIESLDEALALYPDDLIGLRSIEESLTGIGPMQQFRLDGQSVIEEFEASGIEYNTGQLLVLDYTVVRIFPDGASQDLTHNIFRVQSEEAADALGEFQIPEGARLLTLHTIKADGRKLEPDPIAGKDSLSLPSLSPGDYLEFEYVQGTGPAPAFPGGYLGNRFYFQSFQVPFHHSQLKLVLPTDVQTVLDERGPLPPMQEERLQDLRVLSWTARQSPALEPEPMTIPLKEFLPSVNVGISANWESYMQSLRALLVDKDVHDPEIEAFVQRLVAEIPEQDALGRARAIHGWVQSQIEQTSAFFGPSAAMWASRTGHRTRLLHYMLGMAGIPSDMVLVRTVASDHLPSPLPDPSVYGHLLVRLQLGDTVHWLDTSNRWMPFGYVPDSLRDQPGLLLVGSARGEPDSPSERIQIPAAGFSQDSNQKLTVEIDLKPDGSASVRAVETLSGAKAIEWREDLEGIPSAQLNSRFEQGYVAALFPGAILQGLEVEQARVADAPLRLRYSFAVPNLGRWSEGGDSFRVAPLAPALLVSRYAREAERRYARLLTSTVHTELQFDLRFPEGLELRHLPGPVELKGAGGTFFSASAGTIPGGIRWRRETRIPTGRISASEYKAFADFCRAVDQAESLEIGLFRAP